MDDSMDFDQEDLHQFPNLDTNSSTPHPNNKICKRNTSDGSAPPSSWKYSYDQVSWWLHLYIYILPYILSMYMLYGPKKLNAL